MLFSTFTIGSRPPLAFDLANHWIADQGLRTPDSNRDSFTVLEDADEIEAALAERMHGWVGFHNVLVLVHDYINIDHRIAYAAIRDELDDLAQFLIWAAGKLDPQGVVATSIDAEPRQDCHAPCIDSTLPADHPSPTALRHMDSRVRANDTEGVPDGTEAFDRIASTALNCAQLRRAPIIAASERFAMSRASKLSSASQARRMPRTAGYSSPRIKYHAVSRLSPL